MTDASLALLELNLRRILATLNTPPKFRSNYRPGLMLTDIASRAQVTITNTEMIVSALETGGLVEALGPPPTHYRLKRR